jgi:hypothetical protein
MFRFTCTACGEVHEGMPAFDWPHPIYYTAVPEEERTARCVLTSDMCMIDGGDFFVRGCIDIPVHGQDESFSWGVWTTLSEKNFRHYEDLFNSEKRSDHGPFFGWLSSHIWVYPDTLNLKTRLHLRDHGVRPYVELEPTDHPLAVEQREGITVERVAEIYAKMTHGDASQ